MISDLLNMFWGIAPAVLGAFLVLNFLLVNTLLLTWMERRLIGRMQMRKGANRVGKFGLLQPISDALKLLLKEDLTPPAADRLVFRLAPYVAFLPTFLIFLTIPFTPYLVIRSLDLGLFYLMAFSGLGIVGLLMAGYSSANKYSLLGGIRAAAQLVSYEIPLVLSVVGVAMIAESLNLTTIVDKQVPVPFVFYQPIGCFIFFVASLTEMGRTPFDIPYADSEIVGGPHVEYSGMRWALFYLGEYISIFAASLLTALLFFGGWQGPSLPFLTWVWPLLWIILKTYLLVAVVIWLRATLPRYRIDQLMAIAWKFLVPLAFVNLILTALWFVYGWPGLLIGLALCAVGVGLYLVRRPGGERPALPEPVARASREVSP